MLVIPVSHPVKTRHRRNIDGRLFRIDMINGNWRIKINKNDLILIPVHPSQNIFMNILLRKFDIPDSRQWI